MQSDYVTVFHYMTNQMTVRHADKTDLDCLVHSILGEYGSYTA